VVKGLSFRNVTGGGGATDGDSAMPSGVEASRWSRSVGAWHTAGDPSTTRFKLDRELSLNTGFQPHIERHELPAPARAVANAKRLAEGRSHL
jgi:hypothetical protein